ncbi:hypothetical protein ANACOL_04220 [Anaerotruncus colihominis DSM 17241]|uniref:Uncharacterized protein n=1 Tax=Anaerotruncus colihominis DSM 17241 TaxID=445972 RepID=B0PHC7_9FIRM|nr:hypothetical protein ANACOL_04220 [Anaerotruncus colihominis DSM 17241]
MISATGDGSGKRLGRLPCAYYSTASCFFKVPAQGRTEKSSRRAGIS